jgi:hypothetical protein
MPAIMSSKFMHAQRFLKRWKAISTNPILTKSEKKVRRQELIVEAKAVGLGSKGFGMWLNRATVANTTVHFEMRIDNRKYKVYDTIHGDN